MDASAVLARYDEEERIKANWPPFLREELPHIVRHVPSGAATPAPLDHKAFIAYSSLNESNADSVIHAQRDWAEERCIELGWKLYGHDKPDDLGKRLVAHGFEPQEPESIMVLPLDDVPPRLLAPPAHEIRRITDPALLKHVKQVNDVVWEEDQADLYAELADTMTGRPEQLSVYVAYRNESPVAAAWLRINEGKPFASLWGGSTLPDYRGRGYYTALLAIRAQEAVRRGARFLTVDAGPMSRPIVARHGFQQITTACDYDLS